MKSCDGQIVLIIVRVCKKLQFRDLNACPASTHGIRMPAIGLRRIHAIVRRLGE